MLRTVKIGLKFVTSLWRHQWTNLVQTFTKSKFLWQQPVCQRKLLYLVWFDQNRHEKFWIFWFLWRHCDVTRMINLTTPKMKQIQVMSNHPAKYQLPTINRSGVINCQSGPLLKNSKVTYFVMSLWRHQTKFGTGFGMSGKVLTWTFTMPKEFTSSFKGTLILAF